MLAGSVESSAGSSVNGFPARALGAGITIITNNHVIIRTTALPLIYTLIALDDSTITLPRLARRDDENLL